LAVWRQCERIAGLRRDDIQSRNEQLRNVSPEDDDHEHDDGEHRDDGADPRKPFPAGLSVPALAAEGR
jgi:hypothetical protein